MPSAESVVHDIVEQAAGTDPTTNRTNGMGRFAPYMNTTIAAVFLALFVWLIHDNNTQAKRDRELFREAIDKIEERQEVRYLRTEATHARMFEKMSASQERQIKAMESATKALERATDKNQP